MSPSPPSLPAGIIEMEGFMMPAAPDAEHPRGHRAGHGRNALDEDSEHAGGRALKKEKT
jgi:hypothetical protein